jgi:archaemetzincin
VGRFVVVAVGVASLAALAAAPAGCGDRQPGGPARAPAPPAPAIPHGTFRATPAPAPAGAFTEDAALFPSKRAAEFGDWLAAHHEEPQTFDEYVQDAPTRPSATRRVLVLQPLGTFTPAQRVLLDTLRDYLGVYFQLEVRVADPLPLPALGTRKQDDGDRTWIQYRTDILVHQVLEPRLPRDAVAYLGITAADLFPEPSWSYVFGVGNLDTRVGVYSLARLEPGFNGDPDTPETRARTLRRALAVLAHETGHMFSLRHCPTHECLMNGVNSLDELDRGTPWLCPECLRKLHYNTGFDIRRHYQELRAFYAAHQMGAPAELAWLDRRLAALGR